MPRLQKTVFAAALFACMPLAAQAQGQTQTPQAQSVGLPDDGTPGKKMTESLCTMCHQTNLITASSGYTKDGWNELIGTMLDLSGAPQEAAALTEYLAKHFPPNTRRAPQLVSGPNEIVFTEWVMPTRGQRTRDPMQAEDGTIWWAGQYGNLIGRFDPKTGEKREYPLPEMSKPHTVELDNKGRPWYTGNMNGTVGRVDPDTGKVTVYKMPDPAAKDPHTMKFDKNNIMWFSLQQSNMIGRLDPETGDIKLVTAPAPRSLPYGVKIDADGTPWIACNGRNCLIKVDPATMALTEIKLPEGSTVRRLDIAADGMIWFVNSSLGRIGRLDPKTGEIKEWPSPSGPKSHPYAIVVVDGIVWYNESFQRPDALVRFDPKTETFQSWAIPSGDIHAGHIRHMRSTREGNLLIHQSSTNRIIQVTVKRRAAEAR
jgi:virginiamycin B lyase